MSEERSLTEVDFENEDLKKEIDPMDNTLKQVIVNYTGYRLSLEEKVTVENVIQVLAEDFPEIVLALAEENFIRGYKQALQDLSSFQTQQENGEVNASSN